MEASFLDQKLLIYCDKQIHRHLFTLLWYLYSWWYIVLKICLTANFYSQFLLPLHVHLKFLEAEYLLKVSANQYWYTAVPRAGSI